MLDAREHPPEASERTNVEYIDRVQKRDIEDVLAENLGKVFGERFTAYRREYLRTLNYEHGVHIPDFPLTVGFELVNRCNLNCIMCYTVNHKTPKATLGQDTIGKVMGEGQGHALPAVIVGLGSEPLLYKKIKDVFRAIRAAGVMDVFLNTNGVLLTEDLAEFLVDSGITRVQISLDAATPETYLKIRRKNELSKIEANIRKLIEVRARKGSNLPVVRVSFVVQPENTHERRAFAEKWSDVVDYVDFQAVSDFSYVDELKEKGDIDHLKDLPHHKTLKEKFCPLPFNSLHVWSNGDVTPCCVFYGKNLVMGNANKNTLAEIWNGEPIKKLREGIMSGKPNPNCRICLAERNHDLLHATEPGRTQAAE